MLIQARQIGIQMIKKTLFFHQLSESRPGNLLEKKHQYSENQSILPLIEGFFEELCLFYFCNRGYLAYKIPDDVDTYYNNTSSPSQQCLQQTMSSKNTKERQ